VANTEEEHGRAVKGMESFQGTKDLGMTLCPNLRKGLEVYIDT
jgi:hypothetical protein